MSFHFAALARARLAKRTFDHTSLPSRSLQAIAAGLYPVVLVTAITLGISYPLLQPGFPLYIDNPMHLAQAHFMVDELLPNTKWISGWAGFLIAGFPVALYYSQLGFWLISLAGLLLGIPVEIAYKMLLIGAYAFSGWALYRLVSPRFGLRAGTVCCSLWLLQYPAIEGLSSVFGGMWNQMLGIGFLFLLIDALDSLYERFALNRVALAALLFGLIALVHPFVTLAAVIVFAIYAVFVFAGRGQSLPLRTRLPWLAIPLLGFGLDSFHLLPVIAAGSWVPDPDWPGYSSPIRQIAMMLFLPAGQVLRETPWLVGTLDSELVRGDAGRFLIAVAKVIYSNLPNIFFGLLSLAGLAYLARGRAGKGARRRLAVVMLVFAAISLGLAGELYAEVPVLKDISFFKTLLPPRFVMFARLGLLGVVALAVSELPSARYPGNKLVFNVAAALIVILAAFGLNYSLGGRQAMMTSGSVSSMGDVWRVWEWVRQNVDGAKTRVLYQDTFGSLPWDEPLSKSHVLGLSPYYTGVDAIGPDYDYPLYPTARLVSGQNHHVFGVPVDTASPDFVAMRMQAFNTQYAVTLEPALSDKLASSRAFAYQADFGNFTIFKLRDYSPTWFTLEGGPGTLQVTALEDTKMVIRVDSQGKNSRLMAKFAYHPYWRATVDGKPAEVQMTSDYLMAVTIPQLGSSEVVLTYSSFNLQAILLAVSSLAIIAAMFLPR